MESGDYSDLTIICGNEKFSVHKVVVCSQSRVLAAAMKNGFKVPHYCYCLIAFTSLDHADLSSVYPGIRAENHRLK